MEAITRTIVNGAIPVSYTHLGIGLYLAREILSREDGYIKVTSEVNKGSTFSVFLPKINANLSKL